MADPTPLLPSEKLVEPVAAPSSIDDIIERYLSSAGTRQLFQAILISVAWAFDAQQTFITIFTDADIGWHCTDPNVSSCLSATSPCGLPEGSWSWNQPKSASIFSEWDLQCFPLALVGLPASAYFLGCFAGSLLLVTLADSWLGRKNMLLLSCLVVSLGAALTAFSPNVWIYSGLRFICGIGRANIPSSALVLATEVVEKRWRDWVGIIAYLCFSLGFMSLPAMAYISRGSPWRNLYLWTSVLFLCYTISVYFLVRESPRWLLVRGRRDEAIEAIKRITNSNGHAIDCSFHRLEIVHEKLDDDVFSALKILWRKKWAFKRLSAVMVAVFGSGMGYYGMPLNLGNLGSNLYLSVAFNALAEVPSALLTLFLIKKMDRRCSVLVFTTATGVTSILCVFVSAPGWKLATEVVTVFGAVTALDVLLIYTIELFPTCVRNSAMSMVRQAMMLGVMVAPLVAAEGREKSSLSFWVFGLVIGGCGLFVACLPETRGRRMSDTIEEEEPDQTNSLA